MPSLQKADGRTSVFYLFVYTWYLNSLLNMSSIIGWMMEVAGDGRMEEWIGKRAFTKYLVLILQLFNILIFF